MNAVTEGIVLKQIKTVNGRKMVLLFSGKFGKISAWTGINEGGRNHSALALRPFTHGRYEIYKGRNGYNINGAEVIKAYFKVGEDVEKYVCASYILEFTDKLLSEELPSAEVFRLVLDFFDLLETRKKKHMTMVIAFQLKAMQIMGHAPEMEHCIRCGKKEGLAALSIKEGGMVCSGCQNIISPQNNESLIYNIDFDIIEVLKYFLGNSFRSIERIALHESIPEKLHGIIKKYRAYHLDIGELKSDSFL